MLAEKEAEWAQNHIAMTYQSTLPETPETLKVIEAAKHNMTVIDGTLAFLRDFIKKEGKAE